MEFLVGSKYNSVKSFWSTTLLFPIATCFTNAFTVSDSDSLAVSFISVSVQVSSVT